MARVSTAYQLTWRDEIRGWTVRFRIAKERFERSTGVKRRGARAAAERAAREVYAEAVRSGLQRRAATGSTDIVEAVDQWLSALAVRPATLELYTKYSRWWVRRWVTVEELTDGVVANYARERLRLVTSKSAGTELGAMANWLAWCRDSGLIETVPVFPKIGASGGTPSKRRTRVAAPEYSPEQIWSVIEALPEYAGRSGVPIRARAIVAYTTTLRPTTLSLLSVPEHYERGRDWVRVTSDIDKEGFARDVPLPSVARAALDSCCPDEGLVFGPQRLDYHVKRAAKSALGEALGDRFTLQHLRSAGITHALERSGNLPGVAYLAGHLRIQTTSGYTRASRRAAEDVVASVWGTSEGTERGVRKKRPA